MKNENEREVGSGGLTSWLSRVSTMKIGNYLGRVTEFSHKNPRSLFVSAFIAVKAGDRGGTWDSWREPRWERTNGTWLQLIGCARATALSLDFRSGPKVPKYSGSGLHKVLQYMQILGGLY